MPLTFNRTSNMPQAPICIGEKDMHPKVVPNYERWLEMTNLGEALHFAMLGGRMFREDELRVIQEVIGGQ